MIVASTPPPPPGAWKYAMVLITYVACASFHASREAYVAVKGDFQRRLHFPTQLLGLLDTTFLVCYGLGLLFSGSMSHAAQKSVRWGLMNAPPSTQKSGPAPHAFGTGSDHRLESKPATLSSTTRPQTSSLPEMSPSPLTIS